MCVKQISMRKLESYNTKKEKEGAFHQENKTQMKSGERHTLKVLLSFFLWPGLVLYSFPDKWCFKRLGRVRAATHATFSC